MPMFGGSKEDFDVLSDFKDYNPRESYIYSTALRTSKVEVDAEYRTDDFVTTTGRD